jgi:hypothetical protein
MKDGEKNMANYQRGTAANIVVGAAALFVSQIDKLVDSTSFDPSKPGPGFNNTIVPDFVLGTSYKDTLANATANWRNVGYTNNGLELTFNPTFGDVTVDQLLDVAKLYKSGMQVTLKTSLAEATLENLLFALAQRGSVDRYALSSTITPSVTISYTAMTNTESTTATSSARGSYIDLYSGDLGDYPVERSLIAVGASTVGLAQTKNTGGVDGNDQTERIYLAYRIVNISNVTVAAKRDSATMFDVEFRLLPDTNGAYGKIVDRTY